jgi:MarR family protein
VTCHRYHLERRPTDEEMDRLMAELLGQPFTDARAMGDRPLDELFASRSHVRILRVLSLLGDDINLTGRDVARRAEISHGRAQEVLVELVKAGVVTKYSEATWTIYEMSRVSPLAPLVRSVFERERQLTSP